LELKLVEDPVTYILRQKLSASRRGSAARHGTRPRPLGDAQRHGGIDTGETWYVLSAGCRYGATCASAVENRNNTNPSLWQVNFTLSPEAAKRSALHSAKYWPPDGHRFGSPVIPRHHPRQDEDSGEITGNFSQESAHIWR